MHCKLLHRIRVSNRLNTNGADLQRKLLSQSSLGCARGRHWNKIHGRCHAKGQLMANPIPRVYLKLETRGNKRVSHLFGQTIIQILLFKLLSNKRFQIRSGCTKMNAKRGKREETAQATNLNPEELESHRRHSFVDPLRI